MVARALFAGTHLENAPQWMLEIEALMMGGWTFKRLPKLQPPEKTSARSSKPRGRPRSLTPEYGVPRHVRFAEPRLAPRPNTSVRHHHFEQKVILASGRGTVSVAERRAAYGEGFNAPDGVISAEVRATNEASYTEGNKSTDAERVVHVTATNGDSFEERMRFWELANDNAHFIGEHSITVTTRGVEESWDRATRDPTMPDTLRETVANAKADPQGQATVTCNDAGVVKRWLKKRTRSFPAELKAHLALATPHNGRVAYSIVGQFPHDMSLKGMQSCLDGLVTEFTSRGVPCQAVIHEPTRKNSKKNWHFHLIHYAGPAEQLPNGRWSFEREQQRDQWGTMKSVPLKRLGRNAEIAEDDWVPKLKRRWSEIVNARAIQEGLATRFTNDTNLARGLPQAQTRYTPGRQALHKQGFFTDREVEQNTESWQNWRKRKEGLLHNAMLSLERDVERLARDRRQLLLGPSARDGIAGQLSRARSVLNEANHYASTAAQAAMLHNMMQSGPLDSLDYYTDLAQTLRRKTATSARVTKAEFADQVCVSAKAYLADNERRIQRLREIHAYAMKKAKEARRALAQFLPKVDARIAHELEIAEAGDRSSVAAVNVSPQMPSRTRQALAAHLGQGMGLSL